jgi:sterol 3beta-glucosyltransferase
MDYARTLIKRLPTDIDSDDAEDATVKDHNHRWSLRSTPDRPRSGDSAPSEDWSVISEQDDRRSSHNNEGNIETSPHKRSSLTAAMLSVLPDALISSPSYHRSNSAS